MPRDGSGVYSKPSGTNGVPNFPIESAKYNIYTDDIVTDLNSPRPIVAGGTGANSAIGAMTSLGGEIASQIVDNYSSFLFQPGSFYSDATTGRNAPVDGHAFSGICYAGISGGLVLEARDVSLPSLDLYISYFNGTSWSPWSAQSGALADNDTRYVNTTGDVMTGNLAITNTGPTMIMDMTATGQAASLIGAVGATSRWVMQLGNGTAESGSNAGSDFVINRYTDAGVPNGTAFYIIRSTGNVAVTQQLTVGNGLSVTGTLNTSGTVNATGNINTSNTLTANLYLGVGQAGTNMTCYFGPGFTHYLNFTGSFTLSDSLSVSGTIVASGDVYAQSGVLRLNSTGTAYINYVSGTSTIVINNPGVGSINHASNNVVQLGGGMQCRQGVSGGYGANAFNIFYSGTAFLYVDNTNLGSFAYTSDYRTKKDIADLPNMWDTVKFLRPIRYTQKAYKNLFIEDNIERWGFIAHELQETLTPSAANGVKDAPDEIQSPNPFTLIAALTKALQEAMTRIEALEAK